MMNEKKEQPLKATIQNQLDDNTELMVLSMLTSKPQSRMVLSEAIGISERAFRSTVRRLRLKGHPICSSSEHTGYWLGSNKEVDILTKELESRAFDLLKTARALKGFDINQITINDLIKEIAE